MLLRWIALFLCLVSAANAAAVGGIGSEFFGPGTKAEMLTLEQAIELALKNNLDAKFERVGIAVEEARRRSATGNFDPIFSTAVTRESIRRPENANDFTSTQAIRQQNAILGNAATVAQSAGITNASINAENARTNAINAATNAQTGGNQPTNLPTDLPTTVAPAITRDDLTVGFDETVFDQQNDRVSSTLQGRTPWGMRYGFQVEANRLRNTFSGDLRTVFPEYQTSATITVIQPLLKNFGPAANLADLRIARLNKKTQILAWKQRVSTSVQNVMSIYYDMLYAMRDVEVKQDAIASGEKLLAQNKRRLDLGFMSPIDVRQAEVAVSTDREALIISKGFFMERQFALKRLILDEFKAQDYRVFVPLTAPRLPIPKIDRPEFMQLAFARRYDYLAALLDAEIQEVRLRFARNQLWPQVDLVGTYGVNGLQGNYGDSFDQGFSGHTPEWTAGVQVQVPLGAVRERAQLNLVKGLKQQAILKIKQTELTVGVDVDTVISRIRTNSQRVETAKQTRELNEEAVRIAYKRLDEGQISSFDIIEQQRKLYDAKSRELAALAELNKSITQLWLATGTILDRQDIFFDE